MGLSDGPLVEREFKEMGGKPLMSANDRQVGGSHYQTGGTQHWDLFGPDYLIGYATKYMRWRKKGGIEDLEKAIHVIEKLKEVLRNQQRPYYDIVKVHKWCDDAGLDWTEKHIVHLIMCQHSTLEDLDEATLGIRHLIATHSPKPETTKTHKKPKPYAEMTDDELRDEKKRLEQANAEATGWGAAVGARAEGIREIEGMLLARTAKRRPSCFDVGTGKICEGDTVVHGGRGGRVVRVDAVLQDGEADISWIDKRSGKRTGETVKWRSLSPLAPQRTPEDGAQHAATAPWMVTESWFANGNISPELRDLFFRRRANFWVLEPHVASEKIPRQLASAYTLGADNCWILRMENCPPDMREYFPSLRTECNRIEFDELPRWRQSMYHWSDAENKYRLSPNYSAWHAEEEQ